MKYPKETLQDWITRSREGYKILSAWEEEFLDSIEEQLERRGTLSDRQIEILERIYTEKAE